MNTRVFSLDISHRMAVVLVFLSSVLFAAKAIIVRLAYINSPELTALQLLLLRLLSALPFFLAILLVSRPLRRINKTDWWYLFVAGTVGYYLASILDFAGLRYIGASLERIILFLYPTITVVLTAIFYKKTIRRYTWLALIFSYLGTLMVMLADETTSSMATGSALWLGSGLVFAAAVAYASYLLLAQKAISHIGRWQTTGWVMLFSTLGCLVHFLLAETNPWQTLISFSDVDWFYGGVLGIFATLIPVTFVMIGIQKIGADESALISAGGPIITLLMAVAFLDESLTLVQWLGCFINIIGVVMVGFKPIVTSKSVGQ